MNKKTIIRLGVNVDHVATIRQARGTMYPDPVAAAKLAIENGADGITMHLREDRRHIQDHDVIRAHQELSAPLNLEMAATKEMVAFAEQLKPPCCCLVPEKRQELTTEGGLNVLADEAWMKTVCERLAAAGVQVSLFIDPDLQQIDAAVRCGAPVIEIHTGTYADAETEADRMLELKRIEQAAMYADKQGLIVNAGHGLNMENTAAIAEIPVMHEFNIGHSLVADAMFVGLGETVRRMKALLVKIRHG